MSQRNLGMWDIQIKAEFWKKLAIDVNGDFKIITTVSKDLNRLELNTEYKKVLISFSESDTKPLFVSCKFMQAQNLAWFEISKSDFIEKVLNAFNNKKVDSNNPDFNKIYLVKTIENNKIKTIINDNTIVNLIMKNDLTFVGGEQGENDEYIVNLNVHRNVNDLKQLKEIYELATMLIDEFTN